MNKLATNLLAAKVDFAPLIAPVLDVLNALLWPCIAIVGAVGMIYCIFLGIKIAKSDEQNSREKAKKDLIGAIVGFLIIFILMVQRLRRLQERKTEKGDCVNGRYF